jgi:localization factor PodJL
MLRDLGLYDGTVYGTVGPTTRAAIRKFQVSTGQPETGEPDEMLFDSLRRKCAAP